MYSIDTVKRTHHNTSWFTRGVNSLTTKVTVQFTHASLINSAISKGSLSLQTLMVSQS